MASERAFGNVTQTEWEWLSSQRIFFGHQSVGQNILTGVEEILTDSPEIRLRVIATSRPDTVTGPGIVHSTVGRNGDVASKIGAFLEAIGGGMGQEGGVAMLKFCYLDFGAGADPRAVFREYSRLVDTVRTRFPNLALVHFTAPLTTVESPLKFLVKRFLSRTTARTLNANRGVYNDLLRSEYGSHGEPLFDLARWESTRPDGTRSIIVVDGDSVEILADEWTTDGGHLNDAGSRFVAERFLTFLARVGGQEKRGQEAES